MTIVQIDRYALRATTALARIARATETMSTLFPQARAINGALINGEPQLLRDLEFIALTLESVEESARHRLVMKRG